MQADEELQSALKEEKSIQTKLNKSGTTLEESAALNSRLKVVYQLLQDMEADKAESRYILAHHPKLQGLCNSTRFRILL